MGADSLKALGGGGIVLGVGASCVHVRQLAQVLNGGTEQWETS